MCSSRISITHSDDNNTKSTKLVITPPPNAFQAHNKNSFGSDSSVYLVLQPCETEDSSSTESDIHSMNSRIPSPSQNTARLPDGLPQDSNVATSDREMQERAKRAKELLSSKFKGIKDKQVFNYYVIAISSMSFGIPHILSPFSIVHSNRPTHEKWSWKEV